MSYGYNEALCGAIFVSISISYALYFGAYAWLNEVYSGYGFHGGTKGYVVTSSNYSD